MSKSFSLSMPRKGSIERILDDKRPRYSRLFMDFNAVRSPTWVRDKSNEVNPEHAAKGVISDIGLSLKSRNVKLVQWDRTSIFCMFIFSKTSLVNFLKSAGYTGEDNFPRERRNSFSKTGSVNLTGDSTEMGAVFSGAVPVAPADISTLVVPAVAVVVFDDEDHPTAVLEIDPFI